MTMASMKKEGITNRSTAKASETKGATTNVLAIMALTKKGETMNGSTNHRRNFEPSSERGRNNVK